MGFRFVFLGWASCGKGVPSDSLSNKWSLLCLDSIFGVLLNFFVIILNSANYSVGTSSSAPG